MRIAVIDHQPMFRRGVVQALSLPFVTIVADHAGSASVVNILRRRRADILIIDEASARQACRATPPQLLPRLTRIVILVDEWRDEATDAETRSTGAVGFIDRSADGHELRSAITSIREDRAYVSPALASRFPVLKAPGTEIVYVANASLMAAQSLGLDVLDVTILRALADSASNATIATTLGITIQRLRYRLDRIYRSLAARNRIEAINKWEDLVESSQTRTAIRRSGQ